MFDNCLAALFDIGIRVRNAPAAHFQFYLYYIAAPVGICHHIGVKLVGEQLFQFRPFDVIPHRESISPHIYVQDIKFPTWVYTKKEKRLA